MKVTAEHLEAMREKSAPLDSEAARERYRSGRFPRAELVKDLDKRYRWDLFYAANLWGVLGGGDSEYTDAHIDTALRSIVPAL